MNGLNFGRRIPGMNNTQQVREQVFEKSEVIQEPKKLGLFEKPVISKELYSEINLFVPQVIGLVICVIAGLFALLLSRLQSVSIYSSVKDKAGEEFANTIATQLTGFNNLVMLGIVMPIAIYGLFLAIKFLLFMPRKNRNIVHRLFKGRAVLTSVEKVEPKMLFDKKNKKTEVMLTNPGKHYDYLTNRPVLFLQEEARTNVSVLPEDLDYSGKGRDIDSMVGNAFHTGYEIARDKLKKEENHIKIVMILCIVILAAVGFIGLMVYRQPEVLTQVVKSALGA